MYQCDKYISEVQRVYTSGYLHLWYGYCRLSMYSHAHQPDGGPVGGPFNVIVFIGVRRVLRHLRSLVAAEAPSWPPTSWKSPETEFLPSLTARKNSIFIACMSGDSGQVRKRICLIDVVLTFLAQRWPISMNASNSHTRMCSQLATDQPSSNVWPPPPPSSDSQIAGMG